jgi:WD40 repeat protein
LITQRILQSFPHGKFVVRCAFSPDAGRWVGTASYDRTISLWEDLKWGLPSSVSEATETDGDGDDPELAGEPTLRYTLRHTITLDQNPETLVFTPDGRYLMYTTRASCLLNYVCLPPTSNTTDNIPPKFEVITKSFNPHPLDSHISFSVLNIVPDPSGRLLACQTGDHAGGTGERVLLYDISPPLADSAAAAPLLVPREQSEDGFTTLALRTRSAPQEVEENPRLSVIWTGEEGDPYVLPRLAWLPDSSGIITTTTAGELVLHSLQGKTVSRLKVHGVPVDGVSAGGAGMSAVVRDLCVVGDKDDVDSWEVVSVGYDATVRIS